MESEIIKEAKDFSNRWCGSLLPEKAMSDLRLALRLQRKAGRNDAVIYIEKNIPVQNAQQDRIITSKNLQDTRDNIN
ncbi:hypothetical protein LCGC14_1331020 [marine sediment metagenome]|uniref:Uncharacterized protein n=1 Tax=marine sediment metagenome TaxID=412755 RepID=A0A0F9KHB6_9ZZZZ